MSPASAVVNEDNDSGDSSTPPGKKLDILNEAGATPLIVASQSGSLEAVKELLHLGASLMLRDAREYTALHAAVAASQLHPGDEAQDVSRLLAVLTELLDAYGRNSSSTDNSELWDGESPLHIAASLGLSAHVR